MASKQDELVRQVFDEGIKYMSIKLEIPQRDSPTVVKSMQDLMEVNREYAIQVSGPKTIKQGARVNTVNAIKTITGEHEIIRGLQKEKPVEVKSTNSIKTNEKSKYERLREGGTLNLNAGWNGLGISPTVPLNVLLPKERVKIADQIAHLHDNEYMLYINDEVKQIPSPDIARQKINALTGDLAVTNNTHQVLISSIYGNTGDTVLRDFRWEKQDGASGSPDLYVLRARSKVSGLPVGLLFPRKGEDYIMIATARGGAYHKRSSLFGFLRRARKKFPDNPSQITQRTIIATTLSEEEFVFSPVDPEDTNAECKGCRWQNPFFGGDKEARDFCSRGVHPPTHIVTSILFALGLVMHEHYEYGSFDASVVESQYTRLPRSSKIETKQVHTANMKYDELERHSYEQAFTIVRFVKSNELNTTNFAWG